MLALNPDYPEAHKNLGSTRMNQGRPDEAAECYERALALRPDYIDSANGPGRFPFGPRRLPTWLARLRVRLGIPGFLPLPNLPRWTGEPLAGRSLLLVAEQGLGDALHFVRYARLLKERGARLVLAAPPALGKLFSSYPHVDELFILGRSRKCRVAISFFRCSAPRRHWHRPLDDSP